MSDIFQTLFDQKKLQNIFCQKVSTPVAVTPWNLETTLFKYNKSLKQKVKIMNPTVTKSLKIIHMYGKEVSKIVK